MSNDFNNDPNNTQSTPYTVPPYNQQAPAPPQPKKKKRWPWIIAIVVILALYGIVNLSHAGGSSTNSASTTAPTTASTNNTTTKTTSAPAQPTAKPKPSVATFGDGTYTVGKDIKPGTYRTRSASPGCYYARLKNFSGSVDGVIANNNTDAPAIVTIAPTDKGFQATNCGTWSADLSAITTSKTSFGDGMYIVGTDIQPGTYKNSGQTGCYYGRLSGFGNTNDDIIANNNTDTPAIITIAAGDKGFQSTSCGTWTKQ